MIDFVFFTFNVQNHYFETYSIKMNITLSDLFFILKSRASNLNLNKYPKKPRELKLRIYYSMLDAYKKNMSSV